MPAGYVIVEMKISDPERYKEYMAAAPATIAALGGEYLVRGGRHEKLEGAWQPARLATQRPAPEDPISPCRAARRHLHPWRPWCAGR